MFYIFLDIDGVLNDNNTKELTPNGYIGIDSKKIEILAKIVNHYKAQIILTSDWKGCWDKNFAQCDKEGQYLVNKLKEYGLTILDKTIDKRGSFYRGQGIIDWLNANNCNDSDFFVFDDNYFEFEKYENIKNRAIWTMDGIQTAKPMFDD